MTNKQDEELQEIMGYAKSATAEEIKVADFFMKLAFQNQERSPDRIGPLYYKQACVLMRNEQYRMELIALIAGFQA